MQSKKLELLLSKLPEDKQDAFFAELKDINPDEYEALLSRYGIELDADEKEFLTTPSVRTLSDSELAGVAGGQGGTCPKHEGDCRSYCCGD